MNVERTPAFNRDLRRLRSARTLRQVERVIEELTASSNLTELTNVRRLQAEDRHYRIRVGDYRLGITMAGDVVVLRRFLHRNEIYRHFP